MYLGESSYGDMDRKGGCGCGDRPTDPEADALFCYLAKKQRRQDPEWDFIPVLKELASTSKHLSAYGIETYFPEAIAMMRKWKGQTQTVDPS